MISTDFLFQPRGAGTAYLFRMRTPAILVGKKNPRTGRPYGREIKESLGGTRSLREALKQRDILLGAIRQQEARVGDQAEGSTARALAYAESLRGQEADEVAHEFEIERPDGTVEFVQETTREFILEDVQRESEKVRRKSGDAQAKRWARIATGKGFPLSEAKEKYLKDDGKNKATSTKAEVKKSVEQLIQFAGEGVTLQDISAREAGRFVTEFLPMQTSDQAPNGPGPGTIKKKVTVLNTIWKWAMKRGYIVREPLTPWHEQGPSAAEVNEAAQPRRLFTPEETIKLLEASAPGDGLGDLIRVALLTVARLEEIAALDAAQVEQGGTGYTVVKGKTNAAARYIPLVDVAREVIKERLKKAGEDGPLFPEFPVRQSTGRRGGTASSRFTTLRRKILGRETDGDLVEHSFRHTWRTAARRAGVDFRTTNEMGGWSLGRDSDLTYDHKREREQYQRDQKKIARWLRSKGYLGKK